MQDDIVLLHHFEPASHVNGPGNRAVIWVQGCALKCQGCFNPETHNFHGGESWKVEALAREILALRGRIEGVTISGGEPAHQARALAKLVQMIRQETHLSIIVFSGYDLDELTKIPGSSDLLEKIDLLIAGRYDASRRVARDLAGSDNKTFHFLTDRYTIADIANVPQAEVLLMTGGEVILSGIDPLEWNLTERE